MTSRLAALVRKELITPDAPLFSGEDGFRFRHILIRDAAYDALPKAARAGLHERFASWLEKHGTELVELDELLGFHLEVACRYRADLGTPDGALALAARRRLAAGGKRAGSRQDYGAAVSLLERAAALLAPDEIDLDLETELSDALFWMGRADHALQRADLLAERAAATGDRVGEISERIREVCSGSTANRARPGTGRLHRPSLAGARGRTRSAGAVHRLLRADRGGGHARADGYGAGILRAGSRACPGGRRRALLGLRGACRVSLLRVPPLRPISSSGSTSANPERRATSSSVPTVR